ncbi:ribosomal protein s28e [Diplocarpon rosae]|nr:ribosomal protein s28e [Diplocarpon rosae]
MSVTTSAKVPSGHFKILYFASAASYTSKDYEILPAPLPISELFQLLEERYNDMKSKVLESCLVTVNLAYVDIPENANKSDFVIKDGDEVAIIPPTSLPLGIQQRPLFVIVQGPSPAYKTLTRLNLHPQSLSSPETPPSVLPLRSNTTHKPLRKERTETPPEYRKRGKNTHSTRQYRDSRDTASECLGTESPSLGGQRAHTRFGKRSEELRVRRIGNTRRGLSRGIREVVV